jgi:cytochrome P450
MPWIDLLWKNPIVIWLGDRGLISNTASPVALFASKRMTERNESEKREVFNDPNKPLDFLARFMQEADKDPEFMNDRQILALTISSVFAGSDSTAIILRAIFYYLLKNPHTMEKLMIELDTLPPQPNCVVGWSTARNLPYFAAVIQESLRLFPAVGIHLERIVPSSGLQVSNYFIPGGTIVGASAWALHAKEEIFGERTEDFRPERWIEVGEEERARMGNAVFTFGMGSRTCIGKNISLLEIYKVVPTILLRFEVSKNKNKFRKGEWKVFADI